MIFQKFSKRQKIAMTWWNRPEFKDKDGIICDGAVRSGKTISMGMGFVLWSMSAFNKTNFAICGKTIAAVRRNVISYLPTWLEGIVTITENISQNKLTITDGKHTNTYYLFGGKDESSAALVQGMTLGGVLLDEVALMPRSFVEQVLARCSVEGSKFWFNCNPEGPTHWFYLEWIKKHKEKNMLFLHFTMIDNLSLSDTIRKRYEGLYTGVFYARYIEGKWVRAEGLVYPMFSKDKHVVDYWGTMRREKRPRINHRHRYYCAIDYGTVNPFAAGLYDYDPAHMQAVKIKELYYKGGSANRCDNEQYYEMLKELIGDYPIDYIVIDPSAASMIETIQKHGKWLCKRANNDVIDGIQDTTKYLNAGAVLFDKNCTNTFDEFVAYSWDEESAAEDKVLKENDHAMDELRYFCRTVLRDELAFIL